MAVHDKEKRVQPKKKNFQWRHMIRRRGSNLRRIIFNGGA